MSIGPNRSVRGHAYDGLSQRKRPDSKEQLPVGTLVTLSDHQHIFLVGDAERYIRGVADALNLQNSSTDATGNPVPKGFLRWNDANGQDVIVNAAQIVSVREAEKPPTNWQVLDRPGVG